MDNSFQKRIENLFRALIQRHLGVDGLLSLRYKIQAFLGSDRGRELSEENRGLFNASVKAINSFADAVKNCEIKIPDVATKEELPLETLSDIFPTLQSDVDSIIEEILSSIINKLQQNVGNMQGDDEAVQELKTKILAALENIQREAESLKDELDEELSDIASNDEINTILGYYRKLESSNLPQKAPTGIIGILIQKIKGLGVGSILIGFIIVLIIQGILWATGQHDAVIGNAWSTALYSVATLGAMLYLVWVAKKSYNSPDYAYSRIMGEATHSEIMEVLTNKEILRAIASMIPMIVGIPNMGTILSSIYGLTVAATSIVMVCVHNLSLTEMNLKEIGVVMVGNILVISLYLVGYKKSLEDNAYGPNYQMHIGMIIFVFLLLFLSFISKRKTNNTTEPGIKSYAVFTITLLVSTFVSFVAGHEYRQLYGGVNSYESRTAA
ncbi:DUF1686 domain-containing protein [Encephalitozoon hellem]|nr:DUF1686 domain-containing protein [Encephalitozoon hellem]